MRLCYLADARGPTPRAWIEYFVERGHEVHVISSYPCPADSLAGVRLYVVPIAFSGLGRTPTGSISGGRGLSPVSFLMARLRGGSLLHISMAILNWLAPLEVHRHVGYVRKLIDNIQPDLIHAMRIPFEGVLATLAAGEEPLLVSVWGNDFTLHAKHYPLISLQTRQTMKRTDALHCDCFRDLSLARAWGFDGIKRSIVLPGSGGIQTAIFHPGSVDNAAVDIADIPKCADIVINPRGFRGYVRNDVFFRAIPLVLEQHPNTIFLCSAMQGNPAAERWVRQLGIDQSIRLLPIVPRQQMSDFFRLAQIAVSPSTHDGTPNTLLEAMACGCFPIAGDIESVHEWINDGVNGLLCDPTDPESLAEAVLLALDNAELRQRAAGYNSRLIAERAEYSKSMAQAEQFYYEIIEMAHPDREETRCVASDLLARRR